MPSGGEKEEKENKLANYLNRRTCSDAMKEEMQLK